eukprot:1151490-Pelagomonas_calceolata.AAC.7
MMLSMLVQVSVLNNWHSIHDCEGCLPVFVRACVLEKMSLQAFKRVTHRPACSALRLECVLAKFLVANFGTLAQSPVSQMHLQHLDVLAKSQDDWQQCADKLHAQAL